AQGRQFESPLTYSLVASRAVLPACDHESLQPRQDLTDGPQPQASRGCGVALILAEQPGTVVGLPDLGVEQTLDSQLVVLGAGRRDGDHEKGGDQERAAPAAARRFRERPRARLRPPSAA